MHFTTLCLWWLHSRCLRNPATSGGSWPLGGIPTNLYLSVSTITVPSWRRGFLLEYVSSEHYCQAEIFCSWYMQIVEPLQQSLQAWTTWLLWSSLMNTSPPSPSVQQGVSVKTRTYTVRFTLHPSISVTSSWLRILLKAHILSLNSKFFNGMGLRLGNGISPCCFTFCGVEYDRSSLNPFFCFAEKIFCFL